MNTACVWTEREENIPEETNALFVGGRTMSDEAVEEN
jgi:hypothetical protein